MSSLSHQYDKLTLRKIAIWLSKIYQKLNIFFKKIAKSFIFLKKFTKFSFFFQMKSFGNFFGKNVKLLAIFWHQMANFRRVKWQPATHPVLSLTIEVSLQHTQLLVWRLRCRWHDQALQNLNSQTYDYKVIVMLKYIYLQRVLKSAPVYYKQDRVRGPRGLGLIYFEGP